MQLSSGPIKPFLTAWSIYAVVMVLTPFVFLARVHIPQKADFGCFYAAGLLARTDASHLYDVGRQRDIQIDAVGPDGGWTVFIQPPYEALLFVPFSLLPYDKA